VPPGRALLLLEGLCVGVPVLYALTTLVRVEPLASMFLTVVTLLGPLAIIAWTLTEPASLSAQARPGALRTYAPVGLFVLFASGAVSWDPAHRALALVVSCTALASAVYCLALARRSTGWVQGRIQIQDGVELVTTGTTYVLEAAPAGSADGDWLTLPRVQMHTMSGGPFRSGRSTGWAPELLPIRRSTLTRGLALRGGTLAAWALLCLSQSF